MIIFSNLLIVWAKEIEKPLQIGLQRLIASLTELVLFH